MQALAASEIRKKFLDFFRRQGHQVVPSAPLVPENDPTLLFTNAGMVPFKDIFTGKQKASYPRAASVQKCVRAGGKHNDLENVGRTARHHTFFEMLGNFSFGDYFKQEAIQFAWQFLTEEIGLPPERLWVTVYHDDEEAFGLWRDRIGIPEERILRLGEKDNFWAMGDTGPCGPCSELIFDRGEEYSCGHPECGIGSCDCDRWREVWNLVFMQYERSADGTLQPLPKPSIDTGMGLERLTSIVQGAETNYDTDLFQPILSAIAELAGKAYERGESGFPFRVIADHIRACSFLIAEGVLPGNEGRSYVLRRILRRASRFGRVLGIEGPFLGMLVPVLVQLMGEAYPELRSQQNFIQTAIEHEELRFHETLDQGLKRLDELVQPLRHERLPVLSGESCFQLYDTYGLPIDLILDVCQESNIRVDQEGFERHLEEQRRRARADRAEKSGAWLTVSVRDLQDLPDTRFVGYEQLECPAKILALFRQSEEGPQPVDEIRAGEEDAWVVLDQTPFYGESGGQVGDQGVLRAPAVNASVTDTQKQGAIFLHKTAVHEGVLRVGSQVVARVNAERREAIQRNHSATHLLHAALRAQLGEHVKQAGSLVEPDRLRFDFTHFQSLDHDTLKQLEDRINEQILKGLPVETMVTDMDTARSLGAMALFQEKYGERVRLVSMGDYSLELCGGTHVNNTGQIGLFRITSEQGVASGVRRIEAKTGWAVVEEMRQLHQRQKQMADLLKTQPELVPQRVEELLDRVADQQKEIENLRRQSAMHDLKSLIDDAKEIAGVRVIVGEVRTSNPQELRMLGDMLRDKAGPSVVVLGTRTDEKAVILVAATREAVRAGVHAGKVVAEAARAAGGGGGGRPDMAQAGGKNADKLPDALDLASNLVVQQLQNGGNNI